MTNTVSKPTKNLKINQDTWIAVDWGTSRLRIWQLNSANKVLAQAQCESGMNGLSPDQFEGVLLQQIQAWLPAKQCTQIIACGMLGSRQGWAEAGYVQTPCDPSTTLSQAPTTDPRINVHICAGIKQASPADVMRGEETQIAGFMAANNTFSGVICLPGTHSKWATLESGEVQTFQTYMTGELYGLLANQSVLRHSVDTQGWDEKAFCQAVLESIDKPQSITAKLFSLRAQTLIDDLNSGAANAALSGYLIGLELADNRAACQSQTVILIGDSTLSSLYAKALSLLNIQSTQTKTETMTLAGLGLAYLRLKNRLSD